MPLIRFLEGLETPDVKPALAEGKPVERLLPHQPCDKIAGIILLPALRRILAELPHTFPSEYITGRADKARLRIRRLFLELGDPAVSIEFCHAVPLCSLFLLFDVEERDRTRFFCLGEAHKVPEGELKEIIARYHKDVVVNALPFNDQLQIANRPNALIVALRAIAKKMHFLFWIVGFAPAPEVRQEAVVRDNKDLVDLPELLDLVHDVAKDGLFPYGKERLWLVLRERVQASRITRTEQNRFNFDHLFSFFYMLADNH